MIQIIIIWNLKLIIDHMSGLLHDIYLFILNKNDEQTV